MIVEVRDYKTVEGKRAEFVRLFRERTAPLQQSLGIFIFGPLLDRDDPDRLLWLRGFPSLAERETMRSQLYDSSLWRDELEPMVMPLLSTTDFRLVELTAGLINDFAEMEMC